MPRVPKHARAPKTSDVLRIGRKHPKLASILAGRSRALFAVRKGAERGEPDKAGDVLLGVYDYERGRSFIALVDTEDETVVAVRETGAAFQLSDEERHDAERIAAADPRVRAHLAGREMNPLTRLYFPPRAHATATHRHAIVFLRPDKSERRYAIVDLTTERVLALLRRGQLAGE